MLLETRRRRKTFPVFSKLAACSLRAVCKLLVPVKLAVAGSYSSAVAKS
jgi:hypothetical protein